MRMKFTPLFVLLLLAFTFQSFSQTSTDIFISEYVAANKVLIAYNSTPTGFRNWTHTPTQKSAPIRLVKGARYYIETLHKQAAGANYLSVGWVLSNGVGEGPIPGNRLSPWNTPAQNQSAAAQDFAAAMEKVNVLDIQTVKGLQVVATPNPSTGYFTLVTRSNSDKILMIILTDIAGRVVEKRLNIAANGTITLGQGLPAGVYFVEVRQGDQKQNLKLIKQ